MPLPKKLHRELTETESQLRKEGINPTVLNPEGKHTQRKNCSESSERGLEAWDLKAHRRMGV